MVTRPAHNILGEVLPRNYITIYRYLLEIFHPFAVLVAYLKGQWYCGSGAFPISSYSMRPAGCLVSAGHGTPSLPRCTRQMISERFGRGQRTVDMELEAQIDVLRDTRHKYEQVLRLARELSAHLYSMLQTQHALGDTFADLSQKSPELQDEFGYNAETQRLLCKNGEILLGAINFFISGINTLVNKTMEDTLMTIKMYENARLEFDAYRADLEELNAGPRDAVALARMETAQQQFQLQREKYERLRSDVTIKLKFLEENKVKVMHKQLVLFHNAISAYFAGNQQQLEQTLKQFNVKLKPVGAGRPSWLEEQ
ncbi:arfaptin-2-like isoform X4 [Paramormyrops kingsleyae]|uniref:arfaptin-2-like isoform X4 n=1 Tax=Paramormyrops kingsleyae TaxID=1676925 RepID=UPI000CD6621C|nr:arfaptin-2-like isoform X4 [Paramormyrops kingsleyae]